MDRTTALLCFYVAGVVCVLAYMATLSYVVGALGVFGDPPHARIVDVVVAAVLITFAGGVQLLRSWRASCRTSARSRTEARR